MRNKLPFDIPKNIKLENGMYIKNDDNDEYLVLRNEAFDLMFLDLSSKVLLSTLEDENIVEIRKSNLCGMFIDGGELIYEKH